MKALSMVFLHLWSHQIGPADYQSHAHAAFKEALDFAQGCSARGVLLGCLEC